jgi:hypothetical protein
MWYFILRSLLTPMKSRTAKSSRHPFGWRLLHIFYFHFSASEADRFWVLLQFPRLTAP